MIAGQAKEIASPEPLPLLDLPSFFKQLLLGIAVLFLGDDSLVVGFLQVVQFLPQCGAEVCGLRFGIAASSSTTTRSRKGKEGQNGCYAYFRSYGPAHVDFSMWLDSVANIQLKAS